MDMDAELEERLKRAKNILTFVSQPIARLGLWPLNMTRKNYIKSVIYIVYQTCHISLEITDLVMVLGDLPEVIANLMVTTFQSTVAFRMLSVRFRTEIHQIIHEINEFHENHTFPHEKEKMIYVETIEKVERFHRFMLMPAWISGIIWFITPIVLHLNTRGDPNNTIPLADPLRMPAIFDMSNINVAILVYLIDLPLLLNPSGYLAVYSIQFAFVNGICGRLACLSHRIRTLSTRNLIAMRRFFGGIVEEHIKIIQLAHKLDNATCILLLVELFNVTFRLVLICYSIIVSVDRIGLFAVFNYSMYLGLVLSCMYANCYMGENLHLESENLFNAYAACNWYEMPQSYQKAFIICMVRAQVPLNMTAGKFYVYTLKGFTGILRTCMAYVSVLRTII